MEEYGIYKNVRKGNNKTRDGHLLYFAECSVCGKTVERRLSELKRSKGICAHNNKSYNIKNKRLKQIYLHMIERCYKENNKDYRFYGERGIRICKKWLDKPESFAEWARNNGYSDNLTIDRIDGTKGYCPKNCRWITAIENSRDKISTRYIVVDGKRMSGKQWSEYLGLGINRINDYVRRYGIENTKSFIKIYKNRKEDKHLNGRENIYCAYMNDK